MGSRFDLGEWTLKQANLSYRYWHSSHAPRQNMAKPFFDRNQCERILKEFKDDSKTLA